MTDSQRFPNGFLWGASTSAYQIEGSPLADGAGPSIWQRFAHSPGRTTNGDTGDIACDHYARYKDDVALMKRLGLQAYRFSISWSRVFPQGTGKINPAGLGFYERLVDELLRNDIKPNATLFHWDLPAALDDRGGWLNRDVADWFGDYATAVFAKLGDRVPMWATLNEPWVVTDGGYLHGALAPGHKNHFEAPIASHNLLRAHGMGVQAFRAESRVGQVGLVVNLEPKDPATDSAADRAAAQRGDAYMNRQYLDPVFKGSYPEEMVDIFGEAWPEFPADDFKLIGQKVDFIGVNYYTRGVVRDDPTSSPVRIAYVRQPEHAYTETGWEMHPESLTRTLLWVTERYGRIPLYVTENGAAFYDAPHTIDGRCDDPLRVWYYREHIKAARAAIAGGADLRGYFAWSLLDNYEWSLGFSKRFGIVHVNYQTLERTPKASAHYYTSVIQSNGAVLDG
ncbi:MAG: beta-glucosidase [Gemmatimonadetes bacterium]|nr:beta-glucosidase [Gemmatimonadota bacterium]